MAKGILTGSAGHSIIPAPQPLRAPFPTQSVTPAILVKAPSVDYRESGFAELDPGNWGQRIRVDHWIITLEQFDVDTAEVLATTDYTMAAAADKPEVQFPADSGGSGYRIQVVCWDTAGRASRPVFSEGVSIIEVIDAPLGLTPPQISTPASATDYGVTASRSVPSTWDNVTSVEQLWQKDNVTVPGETGTSLVTTVADVGKSIRLGEYPLVPARPDLVQFSESITITSSDLVVPAFFDPSDVDMVEIAPSAASGAIGTRRFDYTGLTWDTATWDVVYRSSGSPVIDAPVSNLLEADGTGSVALTTPIAIGTIRYFGLFFQLKANTAIQHPAMDPALTVTIDAVAYPPLTIKIQGEVVEPDEPIVITPLAALGSAPTGTFLTQAVAMGNIYSNGSGINGSFGSGCFPALGLSMLTSVDDADKVSARTSLLAKIDYFMALGSRMPFLEGGAFNHNSEIPMMMGIFMARLDATAWAHFSAPVKAKFDALWDLALVSSAYTASDTNPDFSGPDASNTVRGNSLNMTAADTANLKRGAPNLSLASLMMTYLACAWFGGITAAKARLDFLRSISPTDNLTALRDFCNAQGMTEPYRTLAWATVGASAGHRGGVKTNAPTYAEIRTAITNPQWFGYRIFEDYEHIFSMMIHASEEFENRNNGDPWDTPAFITWTLERAWKGVGVKPGTTAGTLVPAANYGQATLGKAINSAWHPKYEGTRAGLAEVLEQSDESPRSDFNYGMELSRPLFCMLLSTWLAGMINIRSAAMQPAIFAHHRAYQWCQEVIDDGGGWYECAHNASEGTGPSSQFGLAFMFNMWLKCLGPAMGCGIMLNEGFADTGAWSGFGVDGKAVTGGKAVFTASAVDKAISRGIPCMAGKYVEVTYTMSGRSAGALVVELTGGTTRVGTARSANGTYTERLLVNTNNNAIQFRVSTGLFTGSIDVVTVDGPFDTATVGGL